MSSVNIDLAADTILNVMVGQQDENEVREVVFDFSDWYTTYGSGTISLAIQRPKDEWPYEGTLTVDNSTHKATWEISDTDSAYAGVGQIQLSYTVGTAKKKSVVYRFTVYKSLGALGNVITPIQIQTFIDEVTEALEDMQEELNDVKQDLQNISGISADVKSALLQIASKVAYIDDDGQTYYNDLYDALYPEAESISCVYTQTGTVYSTDTLNSLKPDLVVTALYSDGTQKVLSSNEYSLSGTLTAGTSTIIVSYGNLNTSFTVTVTASYSITNTLANIVNSNTSTSTVVGESYYATLTADNGYTISSVNITMGETDITSTAYNEGTISISEVTGNIVITASAYKYSYSYANGDIIKYSAAVIDKLAVGIDLGLSTYVANRRRSFVLDNGDVPMKLTSDEQTYTLSDYYPIPVPVDATQVTVQITPSERYVGCALWSLNEGIYSRDTDDGWKLGGTTMTFVAGEHDYFTIHSKYNSGGTSYPSEPTGLTVLFS